MKIIIITYKLYYEHLERMIRHTTHTSVQSKKSVKQEGRQRPTIVLPAPQQQHSYSIQHTHDGIYNIYSHHAGWLAGCAHLVPMHLMSDSYDDHASLA